MTALFLGLLFGPPTAALGVLAWNRLGNVEWQGEVDDQW